MTMPSAGKNASTASTRPRWIHRRGGHGETFRGRRVRDAGMGRLVQQPAAHRSPSATYRRPKPSNATTPCWNNPPGRHNLNQTASGKPGAVHANPARDLLHHFHIEGLDRHAGGRAFNNGTGERRRARQARRRIARQSGF